MSLGDLIDDLYTKRATRLTAQKEVDKAKAIETTAKDALIKALQDIGIQKGTGLIATASLKTVRVPVITDWDQIYKYVRENDRFDLLHKRLSEVAWRDSLELDQLVPGTEPSNEVELSLTKAHR